jgi:hypothetical protein
MSFKMDTSSILAFDADRFHSFSQFRQRPSFRSIDLQLGLRDTFPFPIKRGVGRGGSTSISVQIVCWQISYSDYRCRRF